MTGSKERFAVVPCPAIGPMPATLVIFADAGRGKAVMEIDMQKAARLLLKHAPEDRKPKP